MAISGSPYYVGFFGLGFVPHRHVRFYVLFLHHPGQHRRCTVLGIADEALRLDVELRFNPIDHVLVLSMLALMRF